MKITIEIENIEEHHAEAIEDMLYHWCLLGNWGASRYTTFFADGDGDFRPKIKVNGEKAKESKHIPVSSKWYTMKPVFDEHDLDSAVRYCQNKAKGIKAQQAATGEYLIDPDWIAWHLHDKEQVIKTAEKILRSS